MLGIWFRARGDSYAAAPGTPVLESVAQPRACRCNLSQTGRHGFPTAGSSVTNPGPDGRFRLPNRGRADQLGCHDTLGHRINARFLAGASAKCAPNVVDEMKQIGSALYNLLFGGAVAPRHPPATVATVDLDRLLLGSFPVPAGANFGPDYRYRQPRRRRSWRWTPSASDTGAPLTPCRRSTS
jgi:hypothetical protein